MKKIDKYGIFAACYSLCIGFFPCFGTSLIISYSKCASIPASIIGLLVGLLPLSIILYIFNSDGSKNIFEYNVDNFKFFGKVLNILFFLSVVYLGFTISWALVKFTITHLLFRNNPYIITIFFFSIVALCVIKGKEVISRSSLFLLLILTILLIFTFSVLTPSVNISNIFPMINVSKSDFFTSVFAISAFGVTPYIGLLSFRKNDIVDNKKINKTIVLSYVAGILSYILFLFFTIGIYGVDLANIFSYPEYYVFKKINVLNFIQRTENVLSIIIYVGLFGSLSTLIYFNRTLLKTTFNIKNKNIVKLITYILAVFVPLLSVFLFKNYKPYFLIREFPLFSYIILGFIFINFIIILIRKKVFKKL